ncbi:D-2-hydroxyacid dehydrogenase family protein [Spiractinospora alimapuensis]|nr:D-2-hydroxyacid dehydrogenase family protein [Spiractinospora alimapuensis]
MVHVLDDYQDVARTYVDWSASPHDLDVHVFHDHLADAVALQERHRVADVLVVMRERTPLPAELLARLPRLRLVVTTGARNSVVDVDAAAARGITVCGTRILTSPAVELTWGLILAALRDIPDQHARMRQGLWQNTVGGGVEGRHLGVVGLGAIGARVARVAHAFGMEVLAWSPNLTAARAGELGVHAVGKEELCRRADVVSIHLRLSDSTRGVIGESELRAMDDTWLVNTSRAEIVDQQSLLRALHEGWIAGLATDVYDTEPPLAHHPLRHAPRTVLTPHIGYVTTQNYELFYQDALEAVTRFLAGDPVRVVAPSAS